MATSPPAQAACLSLLFAELLLVSGIEGLREGAGRGAGSAVVLAGVLGYLSLTAKLPSIVRRKV